MANPKKYDHQKIEKKWQNFWFTNNLYATSSVKNNKRNYYLLVELAYSSGDLHIGHWFGWSAPDVLARYKRMNGYNVLFPVGGFDSFGLPAENAAIKRGVHPKDWTMKNIENMRKQFRTMGPSFDWSKEVITSDPDYYRWTQWLFLQFYKHGLALRKKVASNWCPKCKTVLANEHVENDCCWRHPDTKVIQKKVDQWLLNITSFADDFIWPERPSVDWPLSMRQGQNNWIGKSKGLLIEWEIVGDDKKITTFTTRPDTLLGATFLVLSPLHELAGDLISSKKDREYLSEAVSGTERQRKIGDKHKKGIVTKFKARHPITGQEIPICIADYVLITYGTGAIMGVPAFDDRDRDFAKKHHLDIVKIKPDQSLWQRAESEGWGKAQTNYHLRDWSVSRDRYWGAPVPIIYCDQCGTVPVPEKDLPVKLPYEVDYTPTGKAPLATSEEFVHAKCPKCGGPARRETQTLDTYVDSSWYFMRYPNPQYQNGPFEPQTIKNWLPIDVYFGGPEHILGHTLYARFITKFLHKIKAIDYDEFAQIRFNHGIILGPDGSRMSKSKGNVVNPDVEVQKYGADAVRLFLCFLGPHDQGGPWSEEGVEGSRRFLDRIWNLYQTNANAGSSLRDNRTDSTKLHQTIKKISNDIENFKFNTAVASLMEYFNHLRQQDSISHQKLLIFCQLLAPFAPHLAEELWVEILGQKGSVHTSSWPVYDKRLAKFQTITLAIQVDGKFRGTLTVSGDEAQAKEKLIAQAKDDPKVKKYLKSNQYKEIFVPGKIISFVNLE